MFREAMKEQGHNQHTDSKPNNVRDAVCGNSRAYSIDRVKREAPQYAKDVLSGKMSPNAALVKAGIRDNRQATWKARPQWLQ